MSIFAVYIPDSLLINPGIEPAISGKLIVTHNEHGQLYYQPNGVNFIKAYAKVGSGGSRYIGLAQAWRESFQHPITSQQQATQQYTAYLPFSGEIISRIDEEHRTKPSEAILIELEWNIVAAQVSGSTTQQLNNYRIVYKPDPNGPEINPQINITPKMWREILKAFGWPDYRLIDIRFPKIVGVNWEKSMAEIQAADNAYEGRQDSNVLMACERAYEAVLGTKALTSSEDILKQSIAQFLLNSLPDPHKRDTVVNLLTWIILYCRRMKHTQPTDPNHPLFDVGSCDAELGLILTKAVTAYLSKIKQC